MAFFAKTVRYLGSFRAAEAADIEGDLAMTPEDRVAIVLELQARVYPGAAQQGFARVIELRPVPAWFVALERCRRARKQGALAESFRALSGSAHAGPALKQIDTPACKSPLESLDRFPRAAERSEADAHQWEATSAPVRSRQRLFDPVGGQLAIAEQVELILSNVVRPELIGRTVEVLGEVPKREHVYIYGTLCMFTTLEFLQHHFSKTGQRDLLVTHTYREARAAACLTYA